ncbi:2-oxo-4-hydroxy-4-carboxy-5-ureidoimidazoline decarboxylase [Marinobacter nanhaiticus D15-8W]|uniref:2-oxo-4-hydroxy-4-carboxy-5-ureidoimidazoline decarboxylase n=1 Tax=Marinobacter nanhaiticus D15-8W TaxID=626887 RepID=N6W3Z3_9GAMM|nr:2-oxo-4-hydroxy-4-carboxy-5-ureidoimidazoline decarboxylase [Marinobacter nanhaiticus]ENO14869.1 2-oxo-4-hydroxy-4-carboxy-5-ureidoimidazoline decarboxylase [Marinobacter nanhaiticus D15-8W]BES69437.1 2-oxo-4-hydroxy-4-carboxy-5-ureidoimidazoline decarboxylase [Marinobacter nanhaiticus D15-8W]
MSLERLNQMSDAGAAETLRTCCAATRWVQGMVASRPFESVEDLHEKADRLWPGMTTDDWLEAFEAHPKIGDVSSLKAKFANTHDLASGEQSSTSLASDEVLRKLKYGNDAYLEKFGFIFIICATGKSADEMLVRLEERLENTRADEILNAGREQAKITHLRLDKLV